MVVVHYCGSTGWSPSVFSDLAASDYFLFPKIKKKTLGWEPGNHVSVVRWSGHICSHIRTTPQEDNSSPYRFWSWWVVLFRGSGPRGELSWWGIVLWIVVLVGNGWALFLSGGDLSSWGVVLEPSAVDIFFEDQDESLYTTGIQVLHVAATPMEKVCRPQGRVLKNKPHLVKFDQMLYYSQPMNFSAHPPLLWKSLLH